MKKDVVSYIANCVSCAKVSAKMQKEVPPLYPIPVSLKYGAC